MPSPDEKIVSLKSRFKNVSKSKTIQSKYE